MHFDKPIIVQPRGNHRDHGVLTVTDVAYHRNGISGEPFFVVLFTDSREGPMLAILNIAGGGDVKRCTGMCAILQRDQLAAGNVEFGSNSWRGDVYEESLRLALKEYEGRRDKELGL